jgi:hypothetical protein
MFKHFSTGLLAGGILAAVGLTIAMSDDRTRQRLTKGSKAAVSKASEIIDTVTDKVY